MAIPDDEHDDVPQPPQSNSPEDQIPGVVPIETVLAQSPDVAVLLTGVRAFRSGVAVVLGVRMRRHVPGLNEQVWEDIFDHRRADEAEDPLWQKSRLRWGFVFADGVEVNNLEVKADETNLYGGGGSGRERSCDRDYWLSSLPPAGPLEVFCDWPRVGLPRTTTLLEALPFRDAAARSRPLWP